MVIKVLLIFFISTFAFIQKSDNEVGKIRENADSVGFAQTSQQMDKLISRINEQFGFEMDLYLKENKITKETVWKTAICPHDDYTYAGPIYASVLQNIKAKTVIIFGVCHKAMLFNLENVIVFDSFDSWKAPYGNVKVSDLRNEIINKLPAGLSVINDSCQSVEHSVEAMIPFLQYFNRDVNIIPVLVPYMTYERMDQISKVFAEALKEIMEARKLKWGDDIAILISNDAVHYGDEDWGGKNYARFGTDNEGYNKAVDHEMKIINSCLTDSITPKKIKLFNSFTVQPNDYKAYKWSWCGRYSVPFGLFVSWHLQQLFNNGVVTGTFIKYFTSIDHDRIVVDDIGMGKTAPANLNHWVGYVGVGYK